MSKCVTHFTGCECHEHLWESRLNAERNEIISLRSTLAAREVEIAGLRDVLSDTLHTLIECRDRKCEKSWVRGSVEMIDKALSASHSGAGEKAVATLQDIAKGSPFDSGAVLARSALKGLGL